MIGVGLSLEASDFRRLLERKRPAGVGLFCQIAVLPCIAFVLAKVLLLPAPYAIGLVLLACCPGGPSSNFFCLVAKGDVALSVTLTATSSLITIVTLPLIVNLAVESFALEAVAIYLPVLKTILHIALLILAPMLLGMGIRAKWRAFALRSETPVRRAALWLLVLIIVLLLVRNGDEFLSAARQLGIAVGVLLTITMGLGTLISYLIRLNRAERIAITIEIGVQNAAQAMTIAISPLMFNSKAIALPAVVYGLMMYFFVFSYLGFVIWFSKPTQPQAKSSIPPESKQS